MKPIQYLLLLITAISIVACGGGSNGNDINDAGNGNSGGDPVINVTATATAGPNGSISPAEVTVAENTTVEFTVTPDAGFEIATIGGCDNGVLEGLVYTVTVPIDCSVTVEFRAIGVTTLTMVDYVKSSDASGSDRFGRDVTLNADGTTMVVGANGVNGLTGTAYVFNRDGDVWSEQAIIAADSPPPDSPKLAFGRAVAINDAGNRIAVASAGSSTGEQPFGQVNIFDLVDNNWQSSAVIREPDTIGFAEVLAMDGSGNTIVVTDTNDDSAANLVDGDSSDNSAPVAGAAYVYVFADNGWTRQAYLKGSAVLAGHFFGTATAISGDGNTVAVSASEISVENSGPGSVYIFSHQNGVWTETQRIEPTRQASHFGSSVSLNQDGSIVAIGVTGDPNGASGINPETPELGSALSSGAAYIFELDASTSNWSEQVYLKASNVNPSSAAQFGNSISINGTGDRLVVGAHREGSNGVGINGDQNNIDAFNAGAAYVFNRSNAQWVQEAYLKATNPDSADLLGSSVAISRDGNTIAASSPDEWSAATGINGDGSDNSQPLAGAVYIYR